MIAPGSLILVEGQGWMDRVIRVVQARAYPPAAAAVTHVAISIGGDRVMQATKRGVCGGKLSDFSHYHVVPVPGYWEARSRMLSVLDRWDGAEYGWWQIIAIGIALLTRARIRLNDRDSVICSELAALCLEAAGIPTPGPAAHVCPAQLAAFFGIV